MKIPRFLRSRYLPVLTGSFLLLYAALSSSNDVVEDTVEISRRVSAMGTLLDLKVSANDRVTALNASQDFLTVVERVDLRLSTWRPDSEMSRLNGSATGDRMEISQHLESDLREVRHWWLETDGAFDPGIASLVDAWDLRGSGRVPSHLELAAAREEAGFENLILNAGAAGRASQGFGVEEGAFGKGIALRDAAMAALEAGASCVVADFGGQIEIRGECGERRIEISDPGDRGRTSVVLKVSGASVATSGNSERGLTVDGKPVGHLLDPRTGLPALDWGSVTVVADDAVTADCVATALYVMGPRRGTEWLRERAGLEAIFIERVGEKKTITASAGLRDRLVVIEERAISSGESRVIAKMSSSSE